MSTDNDHLAPVLRVRKKPVEIDVRRWDGSAYAATPIIDWVLAGGGTARYHDPTEPGGPAIAIDTLEGTVTASANDYVACGVEGEFYPIKPAIFHKTYDLVEVMG